MTVIPEEVNPETIESHWVTMACKNHPTLRWVRKNPVSMRNAISRNPQLMFKGEQLEDGSFKDSSAFAIDPYYTLKCRMEGVNPYAPELKEAPSITTWKQLVDFVHNMEELGEKYAFECQCPASDLYIIGESV